MVQEASGRLLDRLQEGLWRFQGGLERLQEVLERFQGGFRRSRSRPGEGGRFYGAPISGPLRGRKVGR